MQKTRYTILIILLSLTNISLWAQNHAFTHGENIRLTVSFNLGFISVKAAQANLIANCGTYNNVDVYNLELAAKTIKAFKSFNIRDTLRAKVDPITLNPIFTQVQSHEDNYFSSYQTTYTQKDTKHYARVQKFKRSGLVSDTTIITDKIYLDVMSFLYQIRNINDKDLIVNKKYPFPMLFQNSTYELYWRYAGRETITVRKGETYNCIKICPCFVEGTLFDKGEVMTIWLTDDQNRIPVFIEARLKIGSIKAVVENIKGNKFPISALQRN